jgi:hypothetical protein
MEPDPQNSAPRRVEAYLDQVLAPLTPRLSAFQRDELRRELRAHLWERVDAYRELGQSEDDAVTEALQQFGGAEDFLRQWRREWTKTASRTTFSGFWQATRLALPLSLSALLLAFLPLLLFFYQMSANRNGPCGWLYAHQADYNHVWLGFCLLLPIALGVVIGRCAPRSAFLGTFAALAVSALIGGLVSLTLSYLWEQELGFREMVDQITWLATFWMPIACTSAAVSGWWMRRSEARRLA